MGSLGAHLKFVRALRWQGLLGQLASRGQVSMRHRTCERRTFFSSAFFHGVLCGHPELLGTRDYSRPDPWIFWSYHRLVFLSWIVQADHASAERLHPESCFTPSLQEISGRARRRAHVAVKRTIYIFWQFELKFLQCRLTSAM